MTERIACIGAGTVGHAWAAVFARAGYEVALYDAKPGEVHDNALPALRRTLEVLADGGMLPEPVDVVAARVRDAASIAEAVHGAVYVQESVREDVAIKQQVFAEIARAAPGDAILASSTSAIRGSAFLVDLPNPERALVVHPVNPPSVIPLVELCGTGRTSRASIEATHLRLSEAGMKPVVLNKEIDGFILNRLQFTLVAEALHLVGEGYCSPEDLDRVITDGLALRWAFLGPLATIHLNAVDGFKGFVDRLGPMMRHLGEDARTDYEWTAEQIAAIHGALSRTLPIAGIADSQSMRNQNILSLRQLRNRRDPSRDAPPSRILG